MQLRGDDDTANINVRTNMQSRPTFSGPRSCAMMQHSCAKVLHLDVRANRDVSPRLVTDSTPSYTVTPAQDERPLP